MKGDGSGGGNFDDVNVTVLPQVGPYDPQVISSSDPSAVADWLDAHGYVITPEMQPYLATYVNAGAQFLAVRLAPGQSARFTVTVTGPTTPGGLDDGQLVWLGARGGVLRVPVALTR